MEKFWDNYVVIKVENLSEAELINCCLRENIVLRQVKSADDALLISVYSYDGRRLLNILRSKRAKAKIIKKSGLVFTWLALMRRQGLILGLAVCFAVLYVALSYIWSFDISGNEKYTEEDIIAIVEKYGIQKGISKNNLDFEEITKEILKEYNGELSWFWMQPKGTVLEIRLKERDNTFLDYDKRADLVAAKDGIVEDILVLEGTARAEKGEKVQKGQVLIEGVEYDEWEKDEMGIYQPADEGRGIRAQGRVSGLVEYEAIGICSLNEGHLEATGEKEKGYRILKNNEEVYASKAIAGIGLEKILWQKEIKLGEDIWRLESWESSGQQLAFQSYDLAAAYQECLKRGQQTLAESGVKAEDVLNTESLLMPTMDSRLVKVKSLVTVKEDLVEVRYR